MTNDMTETKGVGGDAARRGPSLRLVLLEDLHSGGSYRRAEW